MDNTVINVSLPVNIIEHRTTFIVPDGERVGWWSTFELLGRQLNIGGGEMHNYKTAERARRAAVRLVKGWARNQRLYAKGKVL